METSDGTAAQFELLQHGAIAGMELIPWGSNYTFAVVLRGDDGSTAMGVYKPRRGEVPLRDFPNGTLYKREVAAYQLATLLEWPLVPPTIVREDAPHGVGSLQFYVEPRSDGSAHFDQLRRTHAAALKRMAVFDLLCNNADRKGGHCLLAKDGHLWGIDHGLTFHHVPKLRTVIWDYCGSAIPQALVEHLATRRRDRAFVARVQAAMGPLLSETEIGALFSRWDQLLANPCFPELDPYRNVPWPPF